MPRAIRQHAPGMVFHVTARTQGKAHWFKETLRDEIADYICEAGATSGTRIFALIVMSNHVHIVVRQGNSPLGWMMQRSLQRTSLLVRRSRKVHGHVFGQRYWSCICDDPDYVRQVIIYTHLNAYYAGMCSHPDEYRWSSHSDYAGHSEQKPWSRYVSAQDGLRLFASANADVQNTHDDYKRMVDYWMKRKRLPLGVKYVFTDEERIAAPRALFGDQYWNREYGRRWPHAVLQPSIDIRDSAIAVLRVLDPDVKLDDLRGPRISRGLARLRRKVIAALTTRDYRTSAIARCLRVSLSLVSVVRAEMRAAAASADSEICRFGYRFGIFVNRKGRSD